MQWDNDQWQHGVHGGLCDEALRLRIWKLLTIIHLRFGGGVGRVLFGCGWRGADDSDSESEAWSADRAGVSGCDAIGSVPSGAVAIGG